MKSILSLTRNVLFIGLLGILTFLAFKYFVSQGGFKGVISNTNTLTPKEYTINYVPKDFQANLPDDHTIFAILTNPQRYQRDFEELTYNINTSLLNHVAQRMNLPDSIQHQLLGQYNEHHPYLKRLYFNDFLALQDTTSILYEQWYKNQNQKSVDILYEVVSKYTCFFVNQVLTTHIKTNQGNLYLKGVNVQTPCGVALGEGLRPLIKRLKNEAIVQDFSATKGFLEERVEKAITELATLEITEKKGLSRTLKTEFLGLDVSSTDIEISAISIIKIGFKLQDFFQINLDHNNNQLIVKLPQPTVLSHEVYPSIDKLSLGWLKELGEADFNKNFNLLRAEFRKSAFDEKVKDQARQNAKELMTTMLLPLVQSLGPKFKLNIQFNNPQAHLELKN